MLNGVGPATSFVAGFGYHCDGLEYWGLLKSGTPRNMDMIVLVNAPASVGTNSPFTVEFGRSFAFVPIVSATKVMGAGRREIFPVMLGTVASVVSAS